MEKMRIDFSPRDYQNNHREKRSVKANIDKKTNLDKKTFSSYCKKREKNNLKSTETKVERGG